LVDFDESIPVGYFEIVRLQTMLEKALHSKVDIVTPRALSKYFRDAVLKEAETVYER
jgi:predicted nucleotidyltransferase